MIFSTFMLSRGRTCFTVAISFPLASPSGNNTSSACTVPLSSKRITVHATSLHHSENQAIMSWPVSWAVVHRGASFHWFIVIDSHRADCPMHHHAADRLLQHTTFVLWQTHTMIISMHTKRNTHSPFSSCPPPQAAQVCRLDSGVIRNTCLLSGSSNRGAGTHPASSHMRTHSHTRVHKGNYRCRETDTR